MISSMTGYGRADLNGAAVALSVEMRSVNNRFLDVQVKTPRNLAGLEPRVRKAVQGAFARGRIDVFVNRIGSEGPRSRVVVDHERVGEYLAVLEDLRTRYGFSGDIGLGLVLNLPDVIVREEVPDDLDAVWNELAPALERAMAGMRAMRAQEGAALAADIEERLARIEQSCRDISRRTPDLLERSRARMTESLERLLKEPPDPARVAQEIALLAERTDVTEELTRLGSHLSQFRSLLRDGANEAVGRKLDFLLQEMGREVNTVASKTPDADVARQVVDMKAELEKVREQAQNIE